MNASPWLPCNIEAAQKMISSFLKKENIKKSKRYMILSFECLPIWIRPLSVFPYSKPIHFRRNLIPLEI